MKTFEEICNQLHETGIFDDLSDDTFSVVALEMEKMEKERREYTTFLQSLGWDAFETYKNIVSGRVLSDLQRHLLKEEEIKRKETLSNWKRNYDARKERKQL